MARSKKDESLQGLVTSLLKEGTEIKVSLEASPVYAALEKITASLEKFTGRVLEAAQRLHEYHAAQLDVLGSEIKRLDRELKQVDAHGNYRIRGNKRKNLKWELRKMKERHAKG